MFSTNEDDNHLYTQDQRRVETSRDSPDRHTRPYSARRIAIASNGKQTKVQYFIDGNLVHAEHGATLRRSPNEPGASDYQLRRPPRSRSTGCT